MGSKNAKPSNEGSTSQSLVEDSLRYPDASAEQSHTGIANKPLPPPPDSEPGDAQLFEAKHSYVAKSANELSFLRGDKLLVFVIPQENWWEAKNQRTNEVGWIPSNYVQAVVNEDNKKEEVVDETPWLHGKIARTTAEYLLRSGIDGSFLVRESESTPGSYSISMRHGGKVFHYRISNQEGTGMYFISDDRPFSTLKELVEYHSKNAGGLMYNLKHPVKKKQFVSNAAPVKGEDDDSWEIARDEIVLGRKLGSGQYGEVYEAHWEKANTQVAVKTLKDTMQDDEFLKEANVMKHLRHPNLVKLIGLCTKESPMFIITEFMIHGSLLEYLRNDFNRDQLDATALMHIAAQIASGMQYLESNNFIHRDLAARNCLVGPNLAIKIADFGLSRLLKTEDLYTAKEGSKFPIKWTAPEALSYNVFTTKSDVWAFGIVLWELATYGSTPYPGMDLYHVLEKIESGYRMPRPEGCPVEVYDLMRTCWEFNPDDRPTFADIAKNIENMFPDDGGGVASQVEKVLTLDKMAKLQPTDDDISSPPRVKHTSSSSDVTGRRATAANFKPQRSPSVPAMIHSQRAMSVSLARSRSSESSNTDNDELLKLTQSVFQRARLVRASEADTLFVNIKLLLTDTKSLIDTARSLAGEDRAVMDACQKVVESFKVLAKSAQQLSREGYSDELRHQIEQKAVGMTRQARRLYEVVRMVAPNSRA